MSGSEYLLWSYGRFEKMTFFPPDPLTILRLTVVINHLTPLTIAQGLSGFFFLKKVFPLVSRLNASYVGASVIGHSI